MKVLNKLPAVRRQTQVQRYAFYALAFCLIALFTPAHAQVSVRDSSINMLIIQGSYGGFMPAGDMAARYGYTSMAGAEFGAKFKSNLYVLAGAHFIFSDRVTVQGMFGDLLAYTQWNSGNQTAVTAGYIDANGSLTTPSVTMRGYTIPLRIGFIIKQLRIGKSNPNSGVYIESGCQFIHHKLYLEDNVGKRVPYMNDDYLKGYDRLTEGFGLLMGAGYAMFSSSKFVNFMIGLEAGIHQTTDVRKYNYGTGKQAEAQRTDVLYGFKFSWRFPIYRSAPEEYYFY